MTVNETWKFSQCFGDKGDIENLTEADVISTVEFNHDGNFLATGDKGGRVVLFERNHSKNSNCEYKFFTEFQSHDAEFDYLKSLEIEEKINKIKWIKSYNDSLYLLSTNDKTIKLWKIMERNVKLLYQNNLNGADHLPASGLNLSSLKLPKMTVHDKLISAQPKKIYSNAHAYHINSISVNSDQETYISSDDLRINLWNLGISDQSFNIVDIKPSNMEELTEVITSAEFHPSHCNLFMYSSSKGTIKLNDMRSNSLCDSHSKIFEEYLDPASHNFFTEITSSISDVKFSHDGRYIVSRDYMTVKIWDLAMESKPIKTINVHEHLRDRLCDTYENDAIFDKFEVQFGPDNKSIMTGSYNNNFMIYPNSINGDSSYGSMKPIKMKKRGRTVGEPEDDEDDDEEGDDDEEDEEDDDEEPQSPAADGGFPESPTSSHLDDDQQEEIVLQADKSAFKTKKMGSNNGMMRRRMMTNGSDLSNDFDNIDFKKSILHLSWHPRENSVAIAATNNLFIFSTL
ncbi:protein phosphatase 2A regulatory subunit cdc55 [Yamadazyma tenuis]|uniref:Protein phosphatase PP2A regulatory subunit B n=1 Tax=Candida tenuis (strain ATCC 10573 / BCRC 21748 / CBS 615 / JCM 9827 / NBRC 10315 / NRRL Y-1498 / VKM Y-70) TaxID=590646 RepID=G3BC42_CANTC|nr:protein phosphatase 2A regulatory subunit PR55 [Yamadazyma tenuis ATCC 10573]EGV60779.1 protein phosphatase 2A regulatory subunit PR55 [Yamadazyma tenuis ATCC 10573]WEJ93950.1 protein phosphatase 2A regulatory subunit cdc55 [Yamadazyma tenuis]